MSGRIVFDKYVARRSQDGQCDFAGAGPFAFSILPERLCNLISDSKLLFFIDS